MRAPLTLLIDAEDVLVQPLLDAGYRVAHVETAHDALERLPIVSLVVTELDLPDRDGVVFVSELRDRGSLPIVVCTRCDRAAERTLALKCGADTVIDKAADPVEIVARINAVVRRTQIAVPGATLLTCGRLVVDLARITVRAGGSAVRLTPTQFRLLAVLAHAYGEPVTYETLSAKVWGAEAWGASPPTVQRTLIRVHMGGIRAALRAHGAAHLLSNTSGVGYMLLDPDYHPLEGDS
jgi:two-component system KDP operon response regulator KdpE